MYTLEKIRRIFKLNAPSTQLKIYNLFISNRKKEKRKSCYCGFKKYCECGYPLFDEFKIQLDRNKIKETCFKE